LSFARPQSSGGVEYLPVGRHPGEESVGWIFFKDDPIRGFHLLGWRRSADRTRLQANSLVLGNFRELAPRNPCAAATYRAIPYEN
jgi:hypothetical protein